MRIVEAWGTTQELVELGDDYWLRSDTTYHRSSRRRVAGGHTTTVLLMTAGAPRSATRDGVRYELLRVDAGPPGSDPTSAAGLRALSALRPDLLLLHSANRAQTLRYLQQAPAATRSVLYSNSAATDGPVLDAIAARPGLVARCLFKARSVRDTWCVRTGFPSARTAVFPSGIDTSAFEPADPEAETVDCLWAGYLRANNRRKKNVGALVDLFRRLDATLLVVGGGATEAEVRAGAPANVTFAGRVERTAMPALYRGARLFVFPSLYDPCPRVVTEAMASGLPVVGLGSCVGTEEQIVDGVNGVRAADLADMGTTIGTLLADAPRRCELGRRSRELAVRSFDEDRVDSELLAYLVGVAT